MQTQMAVIVAGAVLNAI